MRAIAHPSRPIRQARSSPARLRRFSCRARSRRSRQLDLYLLWFAVWRSIRRWTFDVGRSMFKQEGVQANRLYVRKDTSETICALFCANRGLGKLFSGGARLCRADENNGPV